MTYEKALFVFESKIFLYYRAYCKNQLVGFIFIKKDDNILSIKHLLFDKNRQGNGIGRVLLKKAIDIGKKED